MREGRGGEKSGIPHLIVVVGFGLGVLLALDFNADELLCAFFWVYNDWRLSAGNFFFGTWYNFDWSIILEMSAASVFFFTHIALLYPQLNN